MSLPQGHGIVCMTPEKLISISPEHQDENEIKQSASLIEQSWSLSDCNTRTKSNLHMKLIIELQPHFHSFSNPKYAAKNIMYLIIFHKENFLVYDRLIVSKKSSDRQQMAIVRFNTLSSDNLGMCILYVTVSISSIFPRPTV